MALQKLEALLSAWRTTAPQEVPLGRLKEAEAYQPRNVRLAPYRDRGRLESASEAHIEDLAAKLADGHDLEPLLVARIGGELFLIDGHHRLRAYRRERRRSVPVRIRESSEAEALLASKAANCDGVKLPMHAEQKREAAWQYLALRTGRGRNGLPEGESLRDIARTFGAGKSTVARMARRLPTVAAGDFPPEACDPGTDWPQWKHVKGNAPRDAFADAPESAKDAQRATKLAAMIERDGIDAFLRSLRLLEAEAIAEAADRLAEAHDVADDY